MSAETQTLPGFSTAISPGLGRVREDGRTEADVIGYVGPDGGPRALSGTDDYAQIQQPVELFGPNLYTTAAGDTPQADVGITVPGAAAIANYLTLPVIDVYQARTLRFDLFWTTVNAAVLGVVAQTRMQGSAPLLRTARWATLAVIDSTLTTPSVEGVLGAYRLMYSSALRSVAATGVGLQTYSLSYNVEEHEAVRLRVGDPSNTGGSQLFATYTLMR